MARARSGERNAETAAFVQELYKAGGFATWKEFADEAGISGPQLSDFQRGVAEPVGGNLLSLIRAAAARGGTDAESMALRMARESFQEQLALCLALLRELTTVVSHLDKG